ncbi:DUF1049 domain-containing protein [Isosphaeraceae bacterium EP7]
MAPVYPYKRRRPSLVKNLWIYRRLVGLAMVLGLMLWFIWANNAAVQIFLPFGMGSLSSTTGMVILLSALAGSVITALTMTVYLAIRRSRGGPSRPDLSESTSIPDDRPPSDYAAKTGEGFRDADWS